MIEKFRAIYQILLILFALNLALILLNCVSNGSQKEESVDVSLTDSELKKADIETLKEIWLNSESSQDRDRIVHEFKKRRSVDGLQFCLIWTTLAYSRSAADGKLLWRPLMKPGVAPAQSKYTIKEAIDIVKALGETKSPEAVEPLTGAIRRIQRNDFLTEILQAFAKIGSPEAISSITEILRNPAIDTHIRIVALDTLGQIKSHKSQQVILPALYDIDARMRWKAVYALGQLGYPEAAGHISFLLGDTDESVRKISEITLKKLGVSDEKIARWKAKAGHVSIEDVYQSKLAQQRAEIEKQELAKQLESERDLKRQLQESLKDQEAVSSRKEDLIESLYEKERQLKSKQAQLDITRQQSEDYQAELQRLNAKVESLKAELKKAKTQTATDSVKEELDKTLEAKSKLEKESKNSEKKESMLREEIATLTALAETTRMEAEATKKEISELRNREKQLTAQVDDLKQRLNRSMAPVLVVSKPEDGVKIESSNTLLHFIAVDDKGIRQLNVSLNGNPLTLERVRGLKVVAAGDESGDTKKIDVLQKLQLQYGQNIIIITATDTDGISQKEVVKIYRVKERGHIWAIIIGINQYQKAQNLKYAVNDAQAFRDYLKDYVGMPDERIFYLANQDATKSRIESLLGTTIKRKASKDDTVIIFYAGHGAVEPDPSNLDGDGFEKYLLPHDANLEDLYSTSISMNDIRTIFMRIHADRLIFIADTCYSGASGGRTMMATKTRANLSDRFYERISKGKGRVIISSCSANEVSKEDDSLQHGIFSYYMLEGLKGRADQDKDGIITISELFGYISRKVPEASAQDQHPVKKGETEGELVIGRTK
jgi:HEAT repeat protein